MSRAKPSEIDNQSLQNKYCGEDELVDSTLRPKTWKEYVGQERVKRNIKIIIEAAKKRNQSPDHLLLYGSSGFGKTTLACLAAEEMGSNVKITSGPAIERIGDLAAILTNLSEGDILFIDEIHRLNRLVEEYLYPAMEDFKLNIIMGKGPMARTMELDIPSFTLIGATTKLALLSSPLRGRFGATFQLNLYTIKDIQKIIQRSAKILGIKIKQESIQVIAKSSRFTPRVANRLLRRVRDFAQVQEKEIITHNMARQALDFLEVDERGLEPGDRKVIAAIIQKFNGGPVGLQTLAASISEEMDTIMDIYEPYLMQIGFIERTSKGRIATKSAYQHLKEEVKSSQNFLC